MDLELAIVFIVQCFGFFSYAALEKNTLVYTPQGLVHKMARKHSIIQCQYLVIPQEGLRLVMEKLLF